MYVGLFIVASPSLHCSCCEKKEGNSRLGYGSKPDKMRMIVKCQCMVMERVCDYVAKQKLLNTHSTIIFIGIDGLLPRPLCGQKRECVGSHRITLPGDKSV